MTQKQIYAIGNAWRISLIVVVLGMAIYGCLYGETKMCPSCRRNFRETYLSDTTKICPYCKYDFDAPRRAYDKQKAAMQREE